MTQWFPKLEYDFEGWHPNPYIEGVYGVWGNYCQYYY